MSALTDRELLELAARAAGYRVRNLAGRYVYILDDDQPDDAMPLRQWNPLTDDGDAFRLAVKLQILVDPGSDETQCIRPMYWNSEKHEGDPYAATRLAIVRAAAAIAKGEKE